MVPETMRFDFNLEKTSKVAYQTTEEKKRRKNDKKITTRNNMKYNLLKTNVILFYQTMN